MTDPKFSTDAIHAGQQFDPHTGAVIPPLYLSSTFVQHEVGVLRNGYEYSRAANPSRTSLQEQLAAIEGGKFAYSFASGLAAEDALYRAILKPGDHVILGNDVYGGSYRLMAKIHSRWGIEFSVVDQSDLAAVEAAIQPNTKLIRVETPSNPLLKIVDLAALVKLAKKHSVLTLADNTFASPALQQPLSYGVDIVSHSTTKYLGGHSDTVGGAIILNDEQLATDLKFVQFAAGAISGPMDAWLTTRGIKTLAVRMERHSSNALELANRLANHNQVAKVYYPGLTSHPQHELAKKQMSAFGGIVSIGLKGGAEAALKLANTLKLFSLAESLGGVESLVNYPSEMTHASVKGTELAVPEEVIRLSVGIEYVEDLWTDLDQALSAL